MRNSTDYDMTYGEARIDDADIPDADDSEILLDASQYAEWRDIALLKTFVAGRLKSKRFNADVAVMESAKPYVIIVYRDIAYKLTPIWDYYHKCSYQLERSTPCERWRSISTSWGPLVDMIPWLTDAVWSRVYQNEALPM